MMTRDIGTTIRVIIGILELKKYLKTQFLLMIRPIGKKTNQNLIILCTYHKGQKTEGYDLLS